MSAPVFPELATQTVNALLRWVRDSVDKSSVSAWKADLLALLAEGRPSVAVDLADPVVDALRAAVLTGDAAMEDALIELLRACSCFQVWIALLSGPDQYRAASALWRNASEAQLDRLMAAAIRARLDPQALATLLWHHTANYNLVSRPAVAILRTDWAKTECVPLLVAWDKEIPSLGQGGRANGALRELLELSGNRLPARPASRSSS